MNAISINGLCKKFNSKEVYDDLSVDFKEGKITAIFGPNGSGKTTLLNILTGLVKADQGKINIKAENKSDIGYIFQNYRDSLLPWKTNYENVAFPLEIANKSKIEIQRQIEELEMLFEFSVDWNMYPYQLSGGQQQLLAFMRALISEPKILFVDEPFSALDYENNLKLREHLQRYFLAKKITIIIITHNIEEAVHLSDSIVVFSKMPTRHIQTIENTLKYPRTVESLKTEEFHRIKDAVLSVFLKSVHI